MDQHRQLTLQTTLKSCELLFNTLFDSIGSINKLPQPTVKTGDNDNNDNIIENELFKLNKFHFYGNNNIDEIFNSIDLQLQTINFTCQQYKQWDVTERESFKFLNTQKLYNQSQQRSNLISKTLFDCSLKGKVYLNQQLQERQKELQQQQKQQQQGTVVAQTVPSNTISKNIEIKRKLGLLAGKLQEMTNELNNKYSTFSVLDDLLGLLKNINNNTAQTDDTDVDAYVSCNISSSTFLLDIDIFNNGEIKEVKLVHILISNGEVEPAEQHFNDELTNSLKTDMNDFIERVKRICDLDLLFRKYKNCDLQKVFSVLQSDFLSISNNLKEKNSINNNGKINYNKGFGEISLDCCGILIKYFHPYIDEISKLNQAYSIMIEMESSAIISNATTIDQLIEDQQPEYSKLSLKSLLNTNYLNTDKFDENNCFINTPLSLILDQDYIFSPVRLVCKLNKPLIITNQQLLKILNLSIPFNSSSSSTNKSTTNTPLPTTPQQQQSQTNTTTQIDNQQNTGTGTGIGIGINEDNKKELIKKYSIQNLLIDDGGNIINNNACFDNQVAGGQYQKYYYTGDFELGLEISRIPISHPSQVYQTIKLLRQQLTFNILFKSCFKILNNNNNQINSTTSKLNNNNLNIPIFEITSSPPISISIIFLHPIENNFNSIDIFIKEDGDLESLYYDNTQNNNIPNSKKSILFTKLLLKSLSIPISLACYLQKN